MKTMVSTAGGILPMTVAPDALEAGAKAGPWTVERELGRGGMGAVYAVVHDEIGKRAALKVVHARVALAHLNPDRMLTEAKVVNQVGHPNIVDIFETGRLEDGRPFIVMERLEGLSLAHRADDGKILPDAVIAILLQVCDALIAAHAAGIVHRDLKLDNIFLCDNPDEPAIPRVKVLDWGIAKIIDHDARATIEGQLVGTPQYLAPEQARGADVSPATDVYSLGVMAYELFLEQLPFEAETAAEVMAMHLRAVPPPPSELWPDIPPELEALLLQMLAKSSEARPSMLDVAHRLEQIRDQLELRRRTAPAATHATAVPLSAPKRPSRLSPVGLAPTMPAELRGMTRRWHYGIGLLAVAAAIAMIGANRASDEIAGAASLVAAPPHAETALPLPPVAPEASVRLADAPAAVDVAAGVSLVIDAPDTTVHRPPPPPVARYRVMPSATRSSSRSAPVAPRRATKIDPDGTIDPY